jgi:hypothetical protein
MVFVTLGCKRDADKTPLSTTASGAADGPVAVAPETAASTPATRSDFAGQWVGSYNAKKSTIALPLGAKDRALEADDGKSAVGPGTVDLTVSAAGDVRGKLAGALGAATITGKLDGAMIRTAVRPDDPYAPNAMTGVLIGERKGEVFACELHVAGPDGTIIRESSVELRRTK